MHRLSLVMVSGDSLVVAVNRLLIAVVSLVAEHRLWSTGSVVVAMLHRLSSPRHVGSSRTRDPNHVSYIGRWILYHRATREAQFPVFYSYKQHCSVHCAWLLVYTCRGFPRMHT